MFVPIDLVFKLNTMLREKFWPYRLLWIKQFLTTFPFTLKSSIYTGWYYFNILTVQSEIPWATWPDAWHRFHAPRMDARHLAYQWPVFQRVSRVVEAVHHSESGRSSIPARRREICDKKQSTIYSKMSNSSTVWNIFISCLKFELYGLQRYEGVKAFMNQHHLSTGSLTVRRNFVSLDRVFLILEGVKKWVK